MDGIKIDKPLKLAIPFNISEAVRDLKMYTAALEHHVEICDDLSTLHVFENRMKQFVRRLEAKRSLLQTAAGNPKPVVPKAKPRGANE